MQGSPVIGFLLSCCLEIVIVTSLSLPKSKKTNALQPREYVHQIKDTPGTIRVPSADRMFKRLEGKGTAVKRSLCSRMWSLLFSKIELKLLNRPSQRIRETATYAL